MSYINQALKKAQEAKDGRYTPYRRFIETAAPPTRRVGYPAWVILGLAILITAVISLTFTAPWKSLVEVKQPPVDAIKKTLPWPPSAPDPVKEAGGVVKVEDIFLLATAAHKLLKFDEAEILYRQILETRPNHRESLNNLGIIFLERGEFPRAREYLERAMAADPTWVYPPYNLACLLGRQGRPHEALVFLKQAAALTPLALKWAAVDDDLTAARKLPEYKKLMEGLAE